MKRAEEREQKASGGKKRRRVENMSYEVRSRRQEVVGGES